MDTKIVNCIITSREGEEPLQFVGEGLVKECKSVTFDGYRILPLEEFARLEERSRTTASRLAELRYLAMVYVAEVNRTCRIAEGKSPAALLAAEEALRGGVSRDVARSTPAEHAPGDHDVPRAWAERDAAQAEVIRISRARDEANGAALSDEDRREYIALVKAFLDDCGNDEANLALSDVLKDYDRLVRERVESLMADGAALSDNELERIRKRQDRERGCSDCGGACWEDAKTLLVEVDRLRARERELEADIRTANLTIESAQERAKAAEARECKVVEVLFLAARKAEDERCSVAEMLIRAAIEGISERSLDELNAEKKPDQSSPRE